MALLLKDSEARNGLRSSPRFVQFLDGDCAQPIHRRFEQHAARNPEAPAVRLVTHDVNYAELNNAANRAARFLLANVTTETMPVALTLDQGYESILWVLAILKAGLCYAPLDQRLPQPALRAILDDLAPSALITGDHYQDAAKRLAAGRIPVISAGTELGPFAAENLDRSVSADRIAYVFYTSGSTGAPKGVADCHRNVLHNIMRYTNSLKFGSGDVMSLVQHPRFSGTVSSLFGALLNGAAIAPFDLQAEGLQSISYWLRRTRVTVFHAVPSIFRQLFDPVGHFPDIRLVRLEGDRASARDVAHFRENFRDDCTLVNGLGATECGLVRQFFIGRHAALENSEPLPIGYPVPDMRLLVVDDSGQPVPFGLAGEIVVESDFLAAGYWRKPALTTEKFVLLPDGLRRYRTGDLGRMDEDGCLVHLGRVDQRLRIAGEFVNAADIEKQLLACPGVSQVAVRDLVDQDGELRLCAYLVANLGAAVTVTQLRKRLAKEIAPQFVPTAFVFLDALPLTSDFKVDYQRLPQAGRRRTPRADTYVAPRSAMERDLVKHWEEILDMRPIGIRDNFFDLGGDSIRAARFFLGIEKTNPGKLPLATIYQAPTVEQLGAILTRQGWTESQISLWSTFPSTVVPFQPNGSKPPLFWFNWGYRDFCLPHYLGSEQPVYGLQHQSQDGHRAVHKTIEQMATHYIDAMRAVCATGPYTLGGLCIGAMVAFEMARQLEAQGDEVALLVLLDPDPLNPRSGISSGDARPWSSSSDATSFREYLRRHLRALAPLSLQQRLSYGLLRVRNRITGLQDKISWFSRRVLCEAFGHPMPLAYRSRYLGTIYRSAARDYEPKPYRGRVVLFKTLQRYRDGELGWGRHLAERLEIEELDAHHDNVFKEPYVQILAERLQVHLSDTEMKVPEPRYERNRDPSRLPGVTQ